ncbi:cell volume regulation protein A (plasmid) [Peptoclostridium acidaminophilum DSM 3953]|uniref:Cell volume regulation protein A n=1 Tax=Peptoclostridium acidaminophilum DSM 3953 TaxID=1286171 RepID=W8T873_PEPAC|nr:cation:proton antiporter [Peptoclostridium acidaminophilum]AHM57914.1 cell volume regulation protein A [Peptoclostridium acidaminophilum DSM 3953]
METSLIASTNSILSLFAIVLITGMILGKLSGFFRLPDVVMFLIGGILIGPFFLDLVGTNVSTIGEQLLLTFGSAFILYDGGRVVRLNILNSVKMTVGLLAILGVALTTLITGFVAARIFYIDPEYALLLGAVIASTDPATLVPVFKSISLREKIKQTIISESAFNDAAGAILVFSIIAAIQNGTFSVDSSLSLLAYMIVWGVIVGALTGIILSFAISDGKAGILHEYAPLVSILAVIISYVLSENLGGSGYMAAFITGLVCGNKSELDIFVSKNSSLIQTNVRDTLSTMLRMAIFIILGTAVDFTVLAMYWKQSLQIVLLLIFVVRPLTVLLCALPDKKAKWTLREILFMCWVRETGVIPAALSGMIAAMQIPHSGIISSVVFMTILVTLLLQASTTQALAQRLGLLEDNCETSESHVLRKII